MSQVIVHQLLHGYRKGHEQLAASINLSSAVADLVTRLSDLSGSLPTGWALSNYLTAYPLPSTGMYALARTWPDREAPRAGCVLTHTLLIPEKAWDSCQAPMRFADYFLLEYEERSLERFKSPILVHDNEREFLRPLHLAPMAQGIEFIAKWFGEGVRPLVWFDCPTPEDAAWAVLTALWPALRRAFSLCTASFQPRSLNDRLFDLHFAPSAVYPRYNKLPRGNIIGGGDRNPRASLEPWCSPCAEWVFEGRQPSPVEEELRAFGPYLGDDPTQMRQVFLARELTSRLGESPTAGAGLLDVVETLSPEPEQALKYKQEAASRSIESTWVSSSEECLKSLFMIGERLGRPAFHAVSPLVDHLLSSRVGMLSAIHATEALSMPERAMARPDESIGTPYMRGLIQGLVNLGHSNPSALLVLRGFEKTAPRLIAASSAVAAAFLRGIHASGGQDDRDALVGWIATCHQEETRTDLRSKLLEEITDEEDVPLVEELLRDISEWEVAPSLGRLAAATKGFKQRRLRDALEELLAKPYPARVREWALTCEDWSRGMFAIVASTFAENEAGLQKVLSFHLDNMSHHSELVATFLARCTGARVPAWFREIARRSADWLVPLIAHGAMTPRPASELLGRLLPELRELPVARKAELLPAFCQLSAFPFWRPLVDLTLQSAASGFVEGTIAGELARSWFSESWASEWLQTATRTDLTNALIRPIRDPETHERAFGWLNLAPDSLYTRPQPILPELLQDLIAAGRLGWTGQSGYEWADCLRRARRIAPTPVTLRVCADAVRFAFNCPGAPVGPAVAAAFYPVYSAVLESRETPPETAELFGWWDWDKAKELRKGLVKACLSSMWAPGDLALAADGDESLTRKLVKRVSQSRNGEAYILAMIRDLEGRKDSRAMQTCALLRVLAGNLDWYEPWD